MILNPAKFVRIFRALFVEIGKVDNFQKLLQGGDVKDEEEEDERWAEEGQAAGRQDDQEDSAADHLRNDY